MDRSSRASGFLSGSSGRILGMEIPLHRYQQGQMGQPTMVPHQAGQLHPIDMMGGLESEQALKGMSMDLGKGKGPSLGHSYSNNTSSEEDGPSFVDGVNGENTRKKRSPWQRMKWKDEVVRLLVAVVSSVGDDGVHEGMDGSKRKCGALQKKGKWKMVSNIMISKGFCVSPQQCEDKFNDLNKRYKKLNDILGRGTSCQVVENPTLMDSLPHLTTKAKDDVKKILGSKQLFYREMCAYHNGQKIPGCHDIDLKAHLMPPFKTHANDNDGCEEENRETSGDSDDNDSYDDDDDEIEIDDGYARNAINLAKSPVEQRERIQYQIWKLEGERVNLEAEALDLEKQRYKWVRFRSKKDRELERSRLENERMRLENERMVLVLKQKGFDLGFQKFETSPEATASHSMNIVQRRD